MSKLNRAEWITFRLEGMVRDANKAKDKLIGKGRLSDLAYQLSWLAGSDVVLLLGAYAEEMLEQANKSGSLKDTLVKYQQVFSYKQKHWRPEHSTSPYSNAMNLAEHTALRDIVDAIEGGLRDLEDETAL